VTRAGGKTACPSTIPDRGMNRSSRPPPARSTPGADRCFAPGHGEAEESLEHQRQDQRLEDHPQHLIVHYGDRIAASTIN
jgi:hypothetical protein